MICLPYLQVFPIAIVFYLLIAPMVEYVCMLAYRVLSLSLLLNLDFKDE